MISRVLWTESYHFNSSYFFKANMFWDKTNMSCCRICPAAKLTSTGEQSWSGPCHLQKVANKGLRKHQLRKYPCFNPFWWLCSTVKMINPHFFLTQNPTAIPDLECSNQLIFSGVPFYHQDQMCGIIKGRLRGLSPLSETLLLLSLQINCHLMQECMEKCQIKPKSTSFEMFEPPSETLSFVTVLLFHSHQGTARK